jgi:hypothetical protein
MEPFAVLAAAAALHEFTLDQVAAYCEGDEHEVQQVIEGFSDHFESIEAPSGRSRWRVADPAALRAAIVQMPARGTRATPPSPRTPETEGRLETRLLLAEATLVECGREPSPAFRQIMASTVMNYLQQVVAAASPGRPDWWEVGPTGLSGDVLSGAGLSMSRIRTDVALARMTACEAAGETMAIDYLIETAVETRRLLLSEDTDRQRFEMLVKRLWSLSRDLMTPSGRGSAMTASTVASARLLSALAWRRASFRAGDDGQAVARELVDLLQGIARGPLEITADHQIPLYHVLADLPHGRQRVAVYSDLLHLLPRTYQVDLDKQILPGALVEAVADAAAAHHLHRYAATIERDLVHSPYRSDSALIGQVVHAFENLAANAATVDDSVVERGERTRVELLKLAGVVV